MASGGDAARKAQLAAAGHGSSGSGKGASTGSSQNIDPEKVNYLVSGGYSKEEAVRIVQKASQR